MKHNAGHLPIETLRVQSMNNAGSKETHPQRRGWYHGAIDLVLVNGYHVEKCLARYHAYPKNKLLYHLPSEHFRPDAVKRLSHT